MNRQKARAVAGGRSWRPLPATSRQAYMACMSAAIRARDSGDHREALRCEERANHILRYLVADPRTPDQILRDRWR